MRASADALPRAGSSTVDMEWHGLPVNWVCQPKQSMDSSSTRPANIVNERIAASADTAAAGRGHAPAGEVVEPMRKRAATRLYVVSMTYRPRGAPFAGGPR
jgi:hypothetical protein